MAVLRDAFYYAGFFQEREARLKGSAQKVALEEIGAEIEPIREAWRWAVDNLNVQAVAQMAWGLSYFYEARGWADEAFEAFNRAAKRIRALHSRIEQFTRDEALTYGRVLSLLARWRDWLHMDPDETLRICEESVSVLKRFEVSAEL